MNQIKIGKFIAECRRDKNLTQEQLAEMLNTTNKSISKWENGNCLPDSSLYEPLCNILEITINELFAGKKIKDKDLAKVYEQLKEEGKKEIEECYNSLH
ncbi:MAG: helix-turn-helix transcriptional regulator [Firmicutes bacterium]|nr:helix-turn-helix transcriptional regulator [Bacillota bacterium]